MKYSIRITDIDARTDASDYWTDERLRGLLDAYDVENTDELPAGELREYLALVTSDLEPAEAAAVALRQTFSEDELSDGQIGQIAHDMLIDKVVEEYPEIAYHERLWYVNQLLYRAYNGKFPSTKASVITCTITPPGETDHVVAKADILRLFGKGLRAHAILPRLYDERMAGAVDFPEADAILWRVTPGSDHGYTIFTSEYWLSAEDFGALEFEGELDVD